MPRQEADIPKKLQRKCNHPGCKAKIVLTIAGNWRHYPFGAYAHGAVGYKVCTSTCGLEKKITEFHLNSKMRDGRKNQCADCTNTMKKIRFYEKRRGTFDKTRKRDDWD